jgi:hypothetical protein
MSPRENHMRITLAALAAVLVAVACGSTTDPAVPAAPTIALDREPVALPAAYVGTTQQESLQVLNQGRGGLIITKVELVSTDGTPLPAVGSGGVFTTPEFSSPLPATIAGLDNGFVRFQFKPDAPGKHDAKLVIESNATLRPKLEIPVSACGVTPGIDGGC